MGNNNLHNTSVPHIFEYHISKYLQDDAVLERDVTFPTFCGDLTIDFVLSVQGKRITGFRFTKKRILMDSEDEWCDAIILGEHALENVYSIPELGIKHKVDDMLFSISRLNARIFSQRGLTNLKNLASTSARRAKIDPENPFVRIRYARAHLWVEHRRIGLDRHADGLYLYAKTKPGMTLQQIQDAYHREILGSTIDNDVSE